MGGPTLEIVGVGELDPGGLSGPSELGGRRGDEYDCGVDIAGFKDVGVK